MSFPRPLEIEDQSAIEMMRDNRNVSYGSQCHFNPIFRYLCKGGDYDISNEKAFLGPDYTCDYWGATHRHTQTHNSFVKSPDYYYLQAGPGPTAPCKTTGLSDSHALTHSQVAIGNSGCRTGNCVTNLLHVSPLGDKNMMACVEILGSCLVTNLFMFSEVGQK